MVTRRVQVLTRVTDTKFVPKPNFNRNMLTHFFRNTFNGTRGRINRNRLHGRQPRTNRQHTRQPKVRRRFQLFSSRAFRNNTTTINLTLTRIIPIIIRDSTTTATKSHHSRRLTTNTFVSHQNSRRLEVTNTKTRTFLPKGLTPTTRIFRRNTNVRQVRNITPRPILTHNLFRPQLPLFKFNRRTRNNRRRIVGARSINS